MSDELNDRMELASRMKAWSRRWGVLSRRLGSENMSRADEHRTQRELESIEHEMRGAIGQAAKLLESDDKIIAALAVGVMRWTERRGPRLTLARFLSDQERADAEKHRG